MNQNLDQGEIARFEQLASSWWDPEGESRPLHELNPARMHFIMERVRLEGAQVADIGCGGGILSEALARQGAHVTGVDMAAKALKVARLHMQEGGLSIDYLERTAEAHAAKAAGSCDLVTCMEMLEHVPDPQSVVHACAALMKSGAHVFLSTLNRTPLAFALAIVGAEHVARLIPRGTHRYDRFIRPSEMSAWLREAGLQVQEISGLHYNPVARSARVGGSVQVNYLVHARKPEAGE